MITVSGCAARRRAGHSCGGQVEVLGRLDVGGDVPHPQQFRYVDEPGEAGVYPESGRRPGQLDRVVTWPKVAAQESKSSRPAVGEQVGAQVALHDVGLGHRVGDRRCGRDGGDPVAVGGPQVVDLHVQVRARWDPSMPASRMLDTVRRF